MELAVLLFASDCVLRDQSQYVKDFCETFKDNLDILPKHIVSSKKIITLLKIHSFNQFKIFSNVFNQYYKSKILS